MTHRMTTAGGRLWVMTPMRPMAQRSSIQMQTKAMPGSRLGCFAGGGLGLCGSVIYSRLQRVQVSEQVLELLLVDLVAEGRHQVVPAQDDSGDTVVIRGRAAGQVLLLVE